MLPISSKKMLPLSARSKSPFFGYTAPVNAPLTCPNSVDSSRSGGRLPESTVTNDLSDARRVDVNGARDELLAGAALAGDEDRGAAGRRLGDQLEHLDHPRAAADDARELVQPPRRVALRRWVFSSRRRRCSIAFRSTTSTSSFLNGLVM